MDKNLVVKYTNCRILRRHMLVKDDVWVREGVILNPQSCFYGENVNPDREVDCGGNIIAPGYIELQINGAFGVDFSYDVQTIEHGVSKVAKGLLAHGVTSFCPTVITSPTHVYHQVVPLVQKCNGSASGAGVLGLHLEGPFISKEKKGAHLEECIVSNLTCVPKNDSALVALKDVYGESFYDNTAIITIAPELPGCLDAIKELTTERSITVSMGHSVGTLKDGEKAVRAGAKFITHLFNAMLPFHHRDPGLVGLLTSWKLPPNCDVFYGLIADGIHTHPATMRIAHRTSPKGIVLVSDAIVAAGFAPGTYRFGQQTIEVRDHKAYVAGTDTLCGSIALLDECVKIFHESTDCSLVEAIEGATLHPAQLLGISDRKGTLEFGTDADFIILDNDLRVLSTYIAGELVYSLNAV